VTITNRFVLAGLGFGEAQVVLSKPAAPERPELAEAKAFLAKASKFAHFC